MCGAFITLVANRALSAAGKRRQVVYVVAVVANGAVKSAANKVGPDASGWGHPRAKRALPRQVDIRHDSVVGVDAMPLECHISQHAALC